MTRSFIRWAIATASLFACVAASAQTYSIVDLGTLGGSVNTTHAFGINASGTVTGYSYDLVNALHAFSYTNGVMTDLGTIDNAAGTISAGYGINDIGKITGISTISGGARRAFVNSNTMVNLGTFPSGGNSEGYGINANGFVAGDAFTSGGALHAFLYDSNTLTMGDLGTLGGTNSSARGINASGQVTGAASTTGNASSVAFRYSGGTMVSLGSLSSTFANLSSIGNAINASGTVTGQADLDPTSSTSHAFLQSGSSPMTDLGTLGGAISAGNAINNSGQVVGYSNPPSGPSLAFLYSGGMMKDLNTLINPGSPLLLYTSLNDGRAINDNGWIVADGFDSQSGTYHSYLLKLDTDGDGVPDSTDNCKLVSNVTQLDTDSDGYGNICDADLNNSGTVTAADFAMLRAVLGQSAVSSAAAANADLNGSGTVTVADFAILRAALGKNPGPSGLHPNCPPTCP